LEREDPQPVSSQTEASPIPQYHLPLAPCLSDFILEHIARRCSLVTWRLMETSGVDGASKKRSPTSNLDEPIPKKRKLLEIGMLVLTISFYDKLECNVRKGAFELTCCSVFQVFIRMVFNHGETTI